MFVHIVYSILLSIPCSVSSDREKDMGQRLPMLPQDGIWQYVSGYRGPFFVYSAFIERRFEVLAIRIIAVAVREDQRDAYCRISLANSTTFTVPAIFQVFREDWRYYYRFTGFFVYCKIKRNLDVDVESLLNSSVEVVFDRQIKVTSALLKVLDTKRNSSFKNEVHVCVKAMHSSYSRVAWLVEWFEANLLMGVSHFYMYNLSMTENVSCILNHYRSLGVVTVLPWNLPVSRNNIFTDGQGAAFNDCLYRSMPRARWLLNIDLDELVFPRPKRMLPKHLNILSLKPIDPDVQMLPERQKRMLPKHLNILSRKPIDPEILMLPARRKRMLPKYLNIYGLLPQRPSCICFENAFFFLKFEDDARKSVRKYPLVTSHKTRRLLYPDDSRGKCAMRPQHVVQMGNHNVWEFTANQSIYDVEPEHGYLHHYRVDWCDMQNCTSQSNCTNNDIKIDSSALQWADDLMSRVKLRRSLLNSCLPSNLSYTDS